MIVTILPAAVDRTFRTTGRQLSFPVFRRPFVKRFALCYRTVVCPVCPVLSVTLVYCDPTVGWIKMPLSMEPRPRRHCVRWGPSSPHGKRHSIPTFRLMSIVVKRSPISATAELLFFLVDGCTYILSNLNSPHAFICFCYVL